MAAIMSKAGDVGEATQRTASGDAGDPAAPASATDRVTDAIIQGIRAGFFVPGQHLLEPDLTRRLGISRGSLREALKHLAAGGIVTLTRFRGAYISALDRKSVLDLLDVLEPLASLGARLAAERCDTDSRRSAMVNAALAIEEAARLRDRARYLECRRTFYDTMLEIGGNAELARVMPLSRTDLFRAQLEATQTEPQRQRHAGGYARVARAISVGDAAAAETAVKVHFDGTRRTMDELPGNAFAPLDGPGEVAISSGRNRLTT